MISQGTARELHVDTFMNKVTESNKHKTYYYIYIGGVIFHHITDFFFSSHVRYKLVRMTLLEINSGKSKK